MDNVKLINYLKEEKAGSNISVRVIVSKEELKQALQYLKENGFEEYEFWKDATKICTESDDEIIIEGE